MSVMQVRCTLHPPKELWLEPHVPADAEGALVGWVAGAAPVDCGIPRDVARIITQTLTRNYRLTFLDPGVEAAPPWQEHATYETGFLKSSRFLDFRHSAGYALTSTITAEAAARLFETEESLWSLQSQIVFLTERKASPPNISFRTIDELVRTRKLLPARLSAEFACVGLMVPGPDGDFAQLILWQPRATQTFLGLLRLETEKTGLTFAEVSESEFRDTKWFVEEVRQ